MSADLVMGAPDSGLDAALGFSQESGIPFGIGLIKNKYIGRTFISPEQGARLDAVKIKLSAVEESVKGKRVVLADDSIVRGNTCLLYTSQVDRDTVNLRIRTRKINIFKDTDFFLFFLTVLSVGNNSFV